MRLTFVLPMALLLNGLPPLSAQPSNDECAGAILLEDASDWCSEAGAFSNQQATPSAGAPSSCFSSPSADLWFSFVPFAADVTITVIGNTGINLLEAPEIALYEGPCGNLLEAGCAAGISQSNVNSLYVGALNPGAPYFIRIGGSGGNTGAFQFCINNYNPPEAPSSDCPEAAILCSKEPFVVQKLVGPGNDPSEANDAPCLNEFSINVEWHSAWFMWTAGSDGPLSFTLTPLNPPDDIDFVVYEFPNGPGDCNDKIPLRCMASSCDGPTGLNETSTDFSEPPNCNDPSQDNFLAAIQMEDGKAYGMMVNNFSSTGIGFEVAFGGSGQIAGPDAAIASSSAGPVCLGETITLQDASSFADGNIVGWEWSFGPGASISNAQTPGPHELSWSTAGIKPVLLRLRTNQGCILSVVRPVEVICCDARYDILADITHLECPGGDNGAISVQAASPNPPYTYRWSNGLSSATITGLTAGQYGLTVTDLLGCDTILNLAVEGPPPFSIDTILSLPACNGGQDGAITLEAGGATPPYLFSWEGGNFTSDESYQGLPAGDYEVFIRDARGCGLMLLIPLRELTLEFAPPEESIEPPSCYGSRDATLTVNLLNGQPPFQYDFNDGNGFVDMNSLIGLGAGAYTVDVRDANQCQGSFNYSIEDPPPLSLDINESPITCHDAADGQLDAMVEGGSGAYAFLWNTGSIAARIEGLGAGAYTLTVTDGNGCAIQRTVVLNAPPALGLILEEASPARCFGEADGSLQVAAAGGAPPYAFALEGQDFQASPRFDNLRAGDYTVKAHDARGCVMALAVTVGEPPPLWVELGETVEVELGYEALLQASSNGNISTYAWSPAEGLSCTDCPSPLLRPLRSGWYLARVEDANGCVAEDSVKVELAAEYPVFIPGAFSPNDDGRNDYFTAYGGPAARQIRSMSIFNRWGALAFKGENLSPGIPVLGWDGTFRNQPAPSGVYTYVIEVEFIDGKRALYTGGVSLIR